MSHFVDFFLCYSSPEDLHTARILAQETEIGQVQLLVQPETSLSIANDKVNTLEVSNLASTATLQAIAQASRAEWMALFLRPSGFRPAYRCVQRLLQVARDAQPAMLYADHWQQYDPTGDSKQTQAHPAIDYQLGSLRDDFDFGGLWWVRGDLLRCFATELEADYRFAAFYALRLYLSRHGQLLHLREMLYTEVALDLRKSGEKQFDYVNPALRDRQIEMEAACTAHLKAIGAWLPPHEFEEVPPAQRDNDFPLRASAIIPVRNRAHTITDAVRSALSQATDFDFNVIVIDNHSTDGTTDLLADLATEDPRLVHLCPDRDDLGIGGCWDVAIRSAHCGRYAVQLDSDDLYSSPQTLQRIVDAFEQEKAAMIIGSYRMVDMALQTLPPGLIDHREWTPENGRNNALRINGLGAPRAFDTLILRQLGVPNTSYGEDYALGLALSRRYRIGRIYDELYLCRRWEGNSDAALSLAKVNAHNAYKDELRSLEIHARQSLIAAWQLPIDQRGVLDFFEAQLNAWPEVAHRFDELDEVVEVRSLETETLSLAVQHNPRRIASTAAKIDAQSLAQRPCFLCPSQRPVAQQSRPIAQHYELLVNPFPLLPRHLTLPTRRHQDQRFADHIADLYRLATTLPDFLVFFNGARCGASAPDHLHFQAAEGGHTPLEYHWPQLETQLERIALIASHPHEGLYLLHGYACPALVVLSQSETAHTHWVSEALQLLPIPEKQHEADLNVLAWYQPQRSEQPTTLVTILFPRRKHRPDCYSQTGEAQLLISPGAIDMAGLLITPRHEDFQHIDGQLAQQLLAEVCYTEAELRHFIQRRYPNFSSDTLPPACPPLSENP